MALILIAEDALLSRKLLCKILQAEGYQTLEAHNGAEAVEIAQQRSDIDCMLLDLLMPELDGMGVLKTLREQGRNLPVIVVTADIQESTRRQCLEMGAIAVINKPAKPELLRPILQKALGEKG